ncbi:MAG: hypothetical protein BWY83_02167 [bacterium ADurb.Bin478]|nr:MAG: hypothetical protein BWY83_02167 [bacterium ADurb.Bin478]
MSRNGKDEVQAQIVEFSPARLANGLLSSGRGVQARQNGQVSRLKGLNPQTQAVDAEPAIITQMHHLCGAGIGLQRDLDILGQGEFFV